MPLEPRDRRALAWGGPVAVILLLYLAFRGSGDSSPSSPMTPAANDLPATYAEAPVAAVPSPTIVAAPTVVVTQPVVVAAAPTTDVAQLRLVGILSRGAVIAMADGTQRFVPVGREIMPGVILRGVDVHHAILATQSGEVRLGFDAAAPEGQAAAPPAAGPGTPPTP